MNLMNLIYDVVGILFIWIVVSMAIIGMVWKLLHRRRVR